MEGLLYKIYRNIIRYIKLYKISGEHIKDVEVNSFNTMIEKQDLKSGAYIYKIMNRNQFVQSGTIIFK